MRRLFANANFDFIGHRRTAYVISGVLLVLSVMVGIYHEFSRGSWANYGVDFTGGTVVQVTIRAPATISDAEVRGLIAERLTGAQVASFGGANEFIIRTPGTGEDAATGPGEEVVAALQQQYGSENVVVERNEDVSAKVGGELQTKALLAILISFAATLLYLAFRFEWRFGLAAVLATGHDVILTLGLLSILYMEISLPTVAAVLTILGYSLNDKIVVFDRARENLRASRRPDFVATLNRSINDTLPRTVLTSGTTLATLLALYLFGGMVIRDFALILIIGIIMGTYSSIFVASPALVEIENRFPHEQPAAKAKKRVAPQRRVGSAESAAAAGQARAPRRSGA